eukprot:4751435-Prymnesium_polylepis.1
MYGVAQPLRYAPTHYLGRLRAHPLSGPARIYKGKFCRSAPFEWGTGAPDRTAPSRRGVRAPNTLCASHRHAAPTTSTHTHRALPRGRTGRPPARPGA